MQHLVFECDNEEALKEVAEKLWHGLGVTGEMSGRPLPGGRWRLEVHSEKELREASLEKVKEYRVEVGD